MFNLLHSNINESTTEKNRQIVNDLFPLTGFNPLCSLRQKLITNQLYRNPGLDLNSYQTW